MSAITYEKILAWVEDQATLYIARSFRGHLSHSHKETPIPQVTNYYRDGYLESFTRGTLEGAEFEQNGKKWTVIYSDYKPGSVAELHWVAIPAKWKADWDQAKKGINTERRMGTRTIKAGERFGIEAMDITPAGGQGPVHQDRIGFQTDTGYYTACSLEDLRSQGIQFTIVPRPVERKWRDLIVLSDGVVVVSY